MPEWKRSPIAGKFYTVEDLMNLPEAGCVNPAKAREVSRNLPLRFWMSTTDLADMLIANIEIIRLNQQDASPEEARQAELLIKQRQLWIHHLAESDEEETFIGLFPASFAGDEYDQEEAITGE